MLSLQHAVLATLLAGAALAADPEKILLWPNGAPGSEGATGEETVRQQNADHVIGNVHKPSITAYLPPKDKATGAAVVLAPGGGHNSLWVDHEGHNEAKWLSEHGVLYLDVADEMEALLVGDELRPWREQVFTLAAVRRLRHEVVQLIGIAPQVKQVRGPHAGAGHQFFKAVQHHSPLARRSQFALGENGIAPGNRARPGHAAQPQEHRRIVDVGYERVVRGPRSS